MGVLDNRVIAITGGGRGIGREVALLSAREGAEVVVNDAGVGVDGTGADEGPARHVVDEIRAGGGTAIAHVGDITDEAQADELVDAALRQFGRLDVLINVAGIIRDHYLIDLEPEDWDAVVRVHLRGTYNTSRAAARHWRTAGGGGYRLINTTSGAGYWGAPQKPNYAAAKMGVIGLTYSCANDLIRYGVTANAVSPAGDTRMNSWKVRPPVPARNAAPAYVFIASQASGWLNGQVVVPRDRSISLLSRPRHVRQFATTEDTWQMQDVFDLFESTFRPFVEDTENPFEAEVRVQHKDNQE